MIHHHLSLSLASIRDAAVIARLSRDLIEHGLPWSWTPGRVAASIRSRQANVVVARAADRLAGFGIMRYSEDDAHLDLLGVEPAFRRQRVGHQLLQWLEMPAQIGGIAAVFLEVRRDNLGAQAFYERLGYRQIAVIDGYYQGREAAVRMRRELSPK
jgi:ribosomal-protein-alanine N-acetyltransferase